MVNGQQIYLKQLPSKRLLMIWLPFANDTLSSLQVFEEDRVSESQLIQDIKFTRHRLELMFRVAHMNRDKTKLLVKTMDPGEPSEGTVSRPPRYNPQQILEIPVVRSDVMGDS